MKNVKKIAFFVVALLACSAIFAQEKQMMQVYHNGSVVYERDAATIDSIIFVSSVQDFAYADDLVNILNTYWENCDKEYVSGESWSQGLTYRSANTPMSGTCEPEQNVEGSFWVKVTNGDGSATRNYKAIDCSTLANMGFRGLTYDNGPYKNKAQFNTFRNSGRLQKANLPWTFAPVSSSKPVREAANLAKWFYVDMNKLGLIYFKNPDTGVKVGSIGTRDDNYSKIKKGDIIFYSKKDANGNWKQADRYMYISHVAVCSGTASNGMKNVIESTNVTVKKHSFSDGTTVNCGVVKRQITVSDYDEAIVMVFRIQPGHFGK